MEPWKGIEDRHIANIHLEVYHRSRRFATFQRYPLYYALCLAVLCRFQDQCTLYLKMYLDGR
jgi:hypothetical protein